MSEHLEPYFLFETRSNEVEGFWPPLHLRNTRTNEERWYQPTQPDKGWSYASSLIEEAMQPLFDRGEWERWPTTIEVEGTFEAGAVERQAYRLATAPYGP